MNLWKIIESSATILIRANLNTDSIETLRIQVNSQILMLHDSYYSLNTVTNLIFFEMLEQQEFEIKKIKKSDSTTTTMRLKRRDSSTRQFKHDINV